MTAKVPPCPHSMRHRGGGRARGQTSTPLPCACPCQGVLQPRWLLISRCPTDLNVLMGFLANRYLKTRQTGLQSTDGLDAVLRWDGMTGTRLTTPASTPRVINEPPTNAQPRPGPQHLPCVLLRAGSHPVSPRGRRPWYRWRDRRGGKAISRIRSRVPRQPGWCQRSAQPGPGEMQLQGGGVSTAGTRWDAAAGRSAQHSRDQAGCSCRAEHSAQPGPGGMQLQGRAVLRVSSTPGG